MTFETFIYWSGQIGQEFAEALADRARAGVRCHVLLDWFGSKRIDPEALRLHTLTFRLGLVRSSSTMPAGIVGPAHCGQRSAVGRTAAVPDGG